MENIPVRSPFEHCLRLGRRVLNFVVCVNYSQSLMCHLYTVAQVSVFSLVLLHYKLYTSRFLHAIKSHQKS